MPASTHFVLVSVFPIPSSPTTAVDCQVRRLRLALGVNGANAILSGQVPQPDLGVSAFDDPVFTDAAVAAAADATTTQSSIAPSGAVATTSSSDGAAPSSEPAASVDTAVGAEPGRRLFGLSTKFTGVLPNSYLALINEGLNQASAGDARVLARTTRFSTKYAHAAKTVAATLIQRTFRAFAVPLSVSCALVCCFARRSVCR